MRNFRDITRSFTNLPKIDIYILNPEIIANRGVNKEKPNGEILVSKLV